MVSDQYKSMAAGEKTGVGSFNFKEPVDPGFVALQDLFGNGKHFLLPSFFKLILFLKKNKREFAIVFHSFDQDLPNVCREFNLFCQGTHPCFNGKNGLPTSKFDNSKGNRFMELNNLNTGYLMRRSDNQDGSHLVLGTFERVESSH